MKLKKILTLALVLGISFSGTSFAFAEEEIIVTPTCPETGCVEESTNNLTFTTNSPEESNNEISFNLNTSTPAYDIFVNAISLDTGTSDVDHITNDNTPTFYGTAEYSESVHLSLFYTTVSCYEFAQLNNSGCTGFYGSATTDEFGNWNGQLNEPVLDGDYYLFVSGPAAVGSDKFRFTIDTKAPEIENAYLYNGAAMNIDFSIFDNKNVNTNNLTIAVNFFKNDFFKAKIYVWDMYNTNGSTDSSEIVNMGHSQEFNSNDAVNFYLVSLNLIDSIYRVMVTAEDIAGNEIEFGLKTFTFNIDTASPEAPVIINPVSGTHDKNEPIQITGTCTPGMTVWFEPRENMAYDSVTDCLDDGTFSYTFHLNVIHDEFPGVTLPITLSARQKDGALNLSEKSNEVTLTEEVVSSGGGSGGGGSSVISEKFLKNDLPLKKKEAQDSTTTAVTTEKVFGASRTCPVFTKFIDYGLENNDVNEVKMWQAFLNKQENAGLNITGFYDFPTYNAVKRFQEKYTEEVLTPWGAKSGTGYIYKTTTKKANQLISC